MLKSEIAGDSRGPRLPHGRMRTSCGGGKQAALFGTVAAATAARWGEAVHRQSRGFCGGLAAFSIRLAVSHSHSCLLFFR